MDLSNEEVEMYDCVNDHSVCDEHLEDAFRKLATRGVEACITAFPEDRREELRGIFDAYVTDNGTIDEQDRACMYDVLMEVLDDLEESRYELPAELCPICTLKNVTQEDVLRMLLYYDKRTYKDVCKEICELYKGDPSYFYDMIKDVSLQ